MASFWNSVFRFCRSKFFISFQRIFCGFVGYNVLIVYSYVVCLIKVKNLKPSSFSLNSSAFCVEVLCVEWPKKVPRLIIICRPRHKEREKILILPMRWTTTEEKREEFSEQRNYHKSKSTTESSRLTAWKKYMIILSHIRSPIRCSQFLI